MKRTRHAIILQILNICGNGANKTRIVYLANLNFKTADPYIDLMTKNGLISIKQGGTRLYETTERGKKLLQNFKQIQNELHEL